MLLFAILASILPTPLVTAASDSWQLVWSDEFDGNSLNTDYWVYDIGTGNGAGVTMNYSITQTEKKMLKLKTVTL